MIVVRLMGGMGNQMFQYATGRALAHRLGSKLGYDLSYLGGEGEGTIRHFELHHFGCVGSPLGWFEDLRFGSQSGASLPRRALARGTRAIWPRNSYKEPSLAFDQSVLSLPSETVIEGRFQSHLYFEEIADILRDDFRLSGPISSGCSALRERARQSKSVGVHVRRTDYVNNAVYKDVIHALPIEYYEIALERMREEIGTDIELFIVSDDIAWCRDQAVFRAASVFVDLSAVAAPHIEEFEVLKNCRNFVISNSTFAWWAAWLSDSRTKLVISPRNWSHNHIWESADRIPVSWVRV